METPTDQRLRRSETPPFRPQAAEGAAAAAAGGGEISLRSSLWFFFFIVIFCLVIFYFSFPASTYVFFCLFLRLWSSSLNRTILCYYLSLIFLPLVWFDLWCRSGLVFIIAFLEFQSGMLSMFDKILSIYR